MASHIIFSFRGVFAKPLLRSSACRVRPPLSLSTRNYRSFSMASPALPPFEKVQIQRDDTVFDAYVTGNEKDPGIVVVQEWWGVDFEIRNHASKISTLGSGFRTLIPDLYRGKVALDTAEAEHLMGGLDWKVAVQDIRASLDWLKANGSSKVGVTGFCMGGALSIASSVLVLEVDAVAAFYGVPPAELADPTLAVKPIQAHFGELDGFVGFSDVTAAKALEEKLKESKVEHEVHLYPGCGHAFMNSSEEGVERRKRMGLNDVDDEAVSLAWSRFQSWMTTHLSSPT